MSTNHEELQSWLMQNTKFIKIKVGQKYTAEFVGMEFDKSGGFQGKPTVKYKFKDLKDSQVREFSSSSKKLASIMAKAKVGDVVTIASSLDGNDRKSYEAVIKSGASNIAEKVAEDAVEADDEIPF